MKPYLSQHPWKLIEEGFDAARHEISESLFSLGNGHMGGRANFEETYSGKTLQGNYIAGVYYPDKTRVGWWKNGYPEYFAKVLNATNWIALTLNVSGEDVDLNTCRVENFTRELDMKEGVLRRICDVTLKNGKTLHINSTRFVSVAHKEIGAIRYEVTPLNFSGEIQIAAALDGNVRNKDANYDEKFWEPVSHRCDATGSNLTLKTRKTEFSVCSAMAVDVVQDGKILNLQKTYSANETCVSEKLTVPVAQGKPVAICKYVAQVTSRDMDSAKLQATASEKVTQARSAGFEKLYSEQVSAWGQKWELADITIEGDVAAQQGIRFNIFQMHQTYSGEDDRLNIGPKGFTGEKYGGSTYWDTEAYCVPFYLGTAKPEVARNLLVYRHRQLEKAKENARKLGFKRGALYPMVTMNGEECHNEWEITFEEIHRNGAIAHAIYNYVNYTGDKKYLGEYGFEVLVEISRFWQERCTWNTRKGVYMILGVTGPNEYENNVNNNWYTNRMAAWTMEYTLATRQYLKETDTAHLTELEKKLELHPSEFTAWKDVVLKMYYPTDEITGVFLQQDGFLDKEIVPVSELPASDRPINQKWSWDRILRSCYIKQADVLQGLYFLRHLYDSQTTKKNFDFYEPLTVHESSLSPCVHSILACQLGYREKAYEMYLRTSRLDLDNYNNDTEDGCHITSMAGTWMSVVHGFGGLQVENNVLCIDPVLPTQWKGFAFQLMYRNAILHISVGKNEVSIKNNSHSAIELSLRGKHVTLNGNSVFSMAQ